MGSCGEIKAWEEREERGDPQANQAWASGWAGASGPSGGAVRGERSDPSAPAGGRLACRTSSLGISKSLFFAPNCGAWVRGSRWKLYFVPECR